MKLETAYRKLAPHRRRWRWIISSTSYNRDYFEVAAYYTAYMGDLPVELLGEIQGGVRMHRIYERGLANAMDAMDDKLDRVEYAIRKHYEAVEAANEAGK